MNAEQILVVGSIDCNDQVNTRLVSWSLGKPARTAEEYGGPGCDVAELGPVDMSALVESRFVVEVGDDSPDEVTARVAAISKELADCALITIGLKNSAYTGTLQPRIAECVELPQEFPWDSRLVNANTTMVELVVRRNPYSLAATESVLDDANLCAPFAFPTLAGQAITDGNSMTIGHPYEEVGWIDPTAPFPAQLQVLLGTSLWLVRNDGVDSQDIDNMAADAATQIDPLFDANRPANVVVCWEGTNEIYYHDDGAAAAVKLDNYCAARQAAGFKVIVLTVLPRSGGSTPADFEAQRQTCNTAIKDPAFHADYVYDCAADSRIGDAGDEMNATYFLDRVHMTKAGNAIIAAGVAEGVAIVSSPQLSSGWHVYDNIGPSNYAVDVSLEGTVAEPVQRLRLAAGNGGNGTDEFILYNLSAAHSLAPGDPVTLDAELKGSASGVTVKIVIVTRREGAWDTEHTTQALFGADVTLTGTYQTVSLAIPACAALTDYADAWLNVQGVSDADSFDISVKNVHLRKTPVFAPCVVPITKLGQFAAPLDLLLESGALELAGCYIAHTDDDAAVLADFLRDAHDLVWEQTGGGAVTGAAVADTASRPAAAFSATGGTKTTDGLYTVHKFTANDSLVCTGTGSAEVLVVGGGGAGAAGGGGAGGYLAGTQILTGTMPVTVGAGGTGASIGVNGPNGADSVFGTRTAKGGGGGGKLAQAAGSSGGSGGGGGASATVAAAGGGATGTPSSQGNAGGSNGTDRASPYPSGGGGGAGAVGQNAPDRDHGGAGGAGINSDIVHRTTNVGYAGGGGGGNTSGPAGGSATHGGGAGSYQATAGGTGTANTGGGGGGSGSGSTGGSGASGIVVVRYLTTAAATVWQTDDATGDTAPVDVTDLAPGSYLVLANCKYVTGATGVEIKQQFGEWTPITTAGLKFLQLGIVSLPTQAVRGAATATLDVSIRGNGTNYAAVDYVAFLPLAGGLTGYVLPSGHVHSLTWEDGLLYADDVADLAHVVASPAAPKVLGGQLIVLAEQVTPAATTELQPTATVMPRWEQFPSA